MANVADFLRRFRYGSVPGAAAIVSVPVDHRAMLEAELGPTLALLDQVQRETGVLISGAQDRALERAETGAFEAHRVIEQAGERAETLRAETTTSILSAAAGERAEALVRARQEARRIEKVAVARADILAAAVVQRALHGLDPPLEDAIHDRTPLIDGGP